MNKKELNLLDNRIEQLHGQIERLNKSFETGAEHKLHTRMCELLLRVQARLYELQSFRKQCQKLKKKEKKR